MQSEIKEGVAAFIVKENNPDFFVGIIEGHTSKATNKIQGMISCPFETLERDENHEHALRRIFEKLDDDNGEEEFAVIKGYVIIPDNLDEAKLCMVQLVRNVWLNVYLLYGSSDLVVAPGKCDDVIGDPVWVNIEDVLRSANGSNRFKYRPGNIEIVKSYLAYLSSDADFDLPIYNAPINSVPLRLFDLLEAGSSPGEVLSQYHFV